MARDVHGFIKPYVVDNGRRLVRDGRPERARAGDDYQEAYETMLHRCSTPWAPWHVIPADRKWARNAAIAAIVRETLEDMNPQYPKAAWDPKSFVIK